jgi:hypothetical protein
VRHVRSRFFSVELETYLQPVVKDGATFPDGPAEVRRHA